MSTMKTAEKRLLDTLDPAGLALVLRAALGRAEMVRIANASRVFVPGMRNRAVSLEHLSEALADKFVAEARRADHPESLRRGAGDASQFQEDGDRRDSRAPGGWGQVRTDAEVGKLLFLLIAEPREASARRTSATLCWKRRTLPSP